MLRSLKWLLFIGVLGAVAVALYRRWNEHHFDPARPRHAWGTVTLTIDEEAPPEQA